MLGSKTPAETGGGSTAQPLVRIVDDEAAILDLFKRMGTLGGFAVATHSTAGALLQSIDDQPGCLVIDLVLPDMTGLELLQELSNRGCQLPVVFMSGMASVAEAVKALKLGSVDFIEKPFEMQAMLTTVQNALRLDEERRRSGQDRETTRQRFAQLTRRETEVMEQIVRGAANKEVAAKLGLSPKTVEVHRANVMRKTQAQSLAELVRMHVAIRG